MQPFDTCWLQIDGGLWEGAFYDGRYDGSCNGYDGGRRNVAGEAHTPHGSANSESEGEPSVRDVTGVAFFRQLAGQAACHFLLPRPSARPSGTWGSWLSRTALAELDRQENRWLEAVCNMPFVTIKDVHGFRTTNRYRLRCLPGDVFTGSAMAMESLLAGSTVGAPPGASSGQEKRNMESLMWLVEEIFRPAVEIAQILADAGWNPGAVLATQEYHDARSRLQAGQGDCTISHCPNRICSK
jgi:hypothetical protein